MGLLSLYQKSNGSNVKASRAIPGVSDPNYFDPQGTFQPGPFQIKEVQGEPTKFTTKAQQYYNTEVKQIVVPSSFIPIDPGVKLNRWSPDKHYTTPDALGFGAGF